MSRTRSLEHGLTALLLLALASAPAAGSSNGSNASVSDPELLIDWLSGVWDNANQVEFEPLGHAANGSSRTRSAAPSRTRVRIVPIRPERLGEGSEHALLLEQFVDSSKVPDRHELLLLRADDEDRSATVVTIHPIEPTSRPGRFYGATLDPERLRKLERKLTAEDLGPREPCEVQWRRRGEAFFGQATGHPCTGSDVTFDSATMHLSREEFWIDGANDAEISPGTPLILRRARAFQCWFTVPVDEQGAVQTDVTRPPSVEDRFRSSHHPEVWDLGERVPVPGAVDSSRRPMFEAELRQRRFPSGDSDEALELLIFEPGQHGAIGSAWTDLDAGRVGVDLRRVRARCDRAEPRSWSDSRNRP